MTTPTPGILSLADFGRQFKEQLDAEIDRRNLKVTQVKIFDAVQAVIAKANEKGIPNQATIDAAVLAWCDRFAEEQEEGAQP